MSQPVFDQQPQAAQPYDAREPYQGEDGPFFFSGLEGASFKSRATMFAVIGIFCLGIIFGPLAIRNAGKAEALGVRAPFARICGWIVFVLSGLNICFFILAAVMAPSSGG